MRLSARRLWSWLRQPSVRRRGNELAAKAWFAFGVHGALRTGHVYNVGPDVAQSVAVLFFLSVYALYEAHMAEAAALEMQEKASKTTPM